MAKHPRVVIGCFVMAWAPLIVMSATGYPETYLGFLQIIIFVLAKQLVLGIVLMFVLGEAREGPEMPGPAYAWPTGHESPNLSDWIEYSYVPEAEEHAKRAVLGGWLQGWLAANHPKTAEHVGSIYGLDRLRDHFEKKIRPTEAVLLAKYKENNDQARQHETIRERTTAMVAQTTGVMLGLTSLKVGGGGDKGGGELATPFIAVFIMILGAWGLASSILMASRALMHRDRVRETRRQLELDIRLKPPRNQMRWLWIIFHGLIVVLGLALLIISVSHRQSPAVAPAPESGAIPRL